MKHTLIVMGLAGLLCIGFAYGMAQVFGDRRTTSRLSPDETLLASLTVRDGHNFQVKLESLTGGPTRMILQAPDSGIPEGTERLIWSKDGRKLLLVGRHFFVKSDEFLDNGDQLFFLYDVPTGKSWLNSSDRPDHPHLTFDTIRDVQFTETVRPR